MKATAFPLGFALGRKTQSGHLPCGQNSAIPLRKEVKVKAAAFPLGFALWPQNAKRPFALRAKLA
ncbi:MAG: hypothetical protein KBG54_06405, partial [Oscillospiraceae bacterium]|nr:hypothetical protein [Oscillospiraceae bacterium]